MRKFKGYEVHETNETDFVVAGVTIGRVLTALEAITGNSFEWGFDDSVVTIFKPREDAGSEVLWEHDLSEDTDIAVSLFTTVGRYLADEHVF